MIGIDIPSYILGLVTGVVGSLIIIMLAGKANQKKMKDGLIDQTMKHVEGHYQEAIEESTKGNFGEAQKEAAQANKELEGMKTEIALDEAIAPPTPETETPKTE